MDPYNLGNRWSELSPISWSITVPYAPSSSTTATVDVVSDVPTVEYQPIEVINVGSAANPTVQFTTVARTFYPFVAYGAGTEYTPNGGSATSVTDPSGNGNCVLYQTNGQVASDTTYCDANPGICTVECTRIIAITAPVCDLSSYTWTFAFHEFQDFSLTSTATDAVSDATWASFSETLLFDSDPEWNVCPSVDATDYSQFTFSTAVYGYFDTSTGDAVPGPSGDASINTALTFGFKIFINEPASPTNPTGDSDAKIYKATLTELKIARPDSTPPFFLVGSSGGVTVGGPGADQDHVHDLSFSPVPAGSVYSMFISDQSTDPRFAAIQSTFTPNVGSPSGPNILYYSDSGTPITLTVTFAGVISLFADGSTPSKKRDVFFRRQVVISTQNGTYANASDVQHGVGSQNSTVVVIQVPHLTKAVNAATIAGSVVGGVIGLGLLSIAVLFYRRGRRAQSTTVILSDKLESGSL